MDNPRQNRRGKVIAQKYYMVKIPRAEPGDTRTQLWSKEHGQNKEIRRLEKRTNKYKSVKQMVIKSNIKETRGGGKCCCPALLNGSQF